MDERTDGRTKVQIRSSYDVSADARSVTQLVLLASATVATNSASRHHKEASQPTNKAKRRGDRAQRVTYGNCVARPSRVRVCGIAPFIYIHHLVYVSQ